MPSTVKTRSFALSLVLALSSVAFVYAGGSTEILPLPKELASVEVIPPFSAKDSTGEEPFQRRHLEDMVRREQGVKRIALVYFATYCAPCAEGMKRLKNAKAALKANGILTVLVNVGEGEDDPEPVYKFVRENGGTGFPLILDIRKQLVDPYGLSEVDGVTVKTIMPKTLVLDSKLRPLFLLGEEGYDFPEVLWKLNRAQSK